MRRKRDLLDALDRCLARVLRGEPVHRTLARHPRYAKKLRPLLEAATWIRQSEPITARPEAVAEGRARMFAALAEKRRAQVRAAASRDSSRDSFRHFAMAFVAVLVVISLLAFGNGFVPWGPQPVSAKALATEVQGVVYRLPGGERTWVPVDDGDRVAVGERVQTLADGRVKLKFHDGTEATLHPASEVVMLEAPRGWVIRRGKTILYQERGRVDVRMARPAAGEVDATAEWEESFEVHTPQLAAGAAGGDYSVIVAEDGTTTLIAGTAILKMRVGGETQILQPGQSRTVGSGPDGAPLDDDGRTPPPPTPSPDAVSPEDSEQPDAGPDDEPTPPGLEDQDGPPDVDDKDGPPGLEDKDGPPGQEDKDGPPGQEDKDTPPGLEDKDVPAAPIEDGSPPGLEDRVTPSAPDDTDVPEEPTDDGDGELPDDGDGELPDDGDNELPDDGDGELPDDGDGELPDDDDNELPDDGPPPHGDGPPYGPPDPPPGLIDKGGTPPGQQKRDE